MNLADRIVALEVGWKGKLSQGYYLSNDNEGWNGGLTENKFTHSWEVAGALIEECEKHGIDWIKVLCDMSENAANESNESIPRAIILACVEALEAV